MELKSDNREHLSPLERKLVATGNVIIIIINHYLPAHVKVELPPNKLFQKPMGTIKDCNPDKTLTERELKMRHVCAGLIIGVSCAIGLFVMMREKRRTYTAYLSLKPDEVTAVQSSPIDEATILATHSADDPAVKSGTLFGNRKLNVGDKVGYSTSDNNLVGSDGKSRNFNTPLVIVADKTQGLGAHSFGEKLAIPANTYAYVYLEREVMTGNLSAPVSAVTYLDVKANGKVILPKGSSLIGQCQSIKGERIEMRFDGVITESGREFSVDGIALGDDNLTGVAALVNRNLPKKTGNLFASALLDSAAQTMNISGDSFGTIFAGNMADRTSNSMGNVIDESSAHSGATIKIPANTRFKVLF